MWDLNLKLSDGGAAEHHGYRVICILSRGEVVAVEDFYFLLRNNSSFLFGQLERDMSHAHICAGVGISVSTGIADEQKWCTQP